MVPVLVKNPGAMEPETKMIRGAKTLKLKHRNNDKQRDRYTLNHNLLNYVDSGTSLWRKDEKIWGTSAIPLSEYPPFPESPKKVL